LAGQPASRRPTRSVTDVTRGGRAAGSFAGPAAARRRAGRPRRRLRALRSACGREWAMRGTSLRRFVANRVSAVAIGRRGDSTVLPNPAVGRAGQDGRNRSPWEVLRNARGSRRSGGAPAEQACGCAADRARSPHCPGRTEREALAESGRGRADAAAQMAAIPAARRRTRSRAGIPRPPLPVASREQAVQQSSDEELRAVLDTRDRREQLGAGVVPQHRVVRDDRRGVPAGPPVRRQVDYRGWEAVGEQDVAAEVAVDQLGESADRPPGGQEVRDLRHARELPGRRFAPRDPVGPRPPIGPGIEDRGRALDGGQRTIEALADREDVPPARRVGASEQRRCRPALHDELAGPGSAAAARRESRRTPRRAAARPATPTRRSACRAA
jgi:hypothetical protein